MAGLIGMGVGAYLSSSSREGQEHRREVFRSRLKALFASFDCALLVSNLGRGHQNIPFWHLVLESADHQVISVRIPLSSSNVDPYSDDAIREMVAYLNQAGSVHA